MKRSYKSPLVYSQNNRNNAVPLVAPLAIFSASSAAAAVGGLVAGAAATKAALKVSVVERAGDCLKPIEIDYAHN